MRFLVRSHALTSRLGPLGLGLALAFLCGACGQGERPAADPFEAGERQLVEAAARARESALALEYSTPETAVSGGGLRRAATGVVISAEGHVLSVRIDRPTSGARPILARNAAGRELPATWLAADPDTGLTLLQVPADLARPAVIAERVASPGLPALVIGNPFGLGPSVSRGLIAGLNRRQELRPRPLGGLIQVDVSLHLGDSGALLTDLRGGWLGLIRSTAATGGEAGPRELDQDLGFAITAADALWVADQLRLHRRIDRAYLGVIPGTNGPVDRATGTASPGLPLGQVLPDSPADRAGLRSGDRLLRLNGATIQSAFDLTDRLDRTAAGSDVVAEVARGPNGGGVLSLTLHTTTRPVLEVARPKDHKRSSEPAKSAKPASAASETPVIPTSRTEKRERERAPERAAEPSTALSERIRQLEQRIRELEDEKTGRSRTSALAPTR